MSKEQQDVIFDSDAILDAALEKLENLQDLGLDLNAIKAYTQDTDSANFTQYKNLV